MEQEAVNQENLYNGNGKRIQKKEGNNVVNYFYQDGVVFIYNRLKMEIRQGKTL